MLSELRRPQPDSGLSSWLVQIVESRLFISSITLGEIQKGIARLETTQRRTALQVWLDQDLQQRFEGRILAVDDAVAKQWGLLQGEALRSGRAVPVIDAQIAATALVANLCVVTRNVQDFQHFPVQLLNPWRAGSGV